MFLYCLSVFKSNFLFNNYRTTDKEEEEKKEKKKERKEKERSKKLRKEDEDDGEGTWETVKGGVAIPSVSYPILLLLYLFSHL